MMSMSDVHRKVRSNFFESRLSRFVVGAHHMTSISNSHEIEPRLSRFVHHTISISKHKIEPRLRSGLGLGAHHYLYFKLRMSQCRMSRPTGVAYHLWNN
jgi:hypothetical protein